MVAASPQSAVAMAASGRSGADMWILIGVLVLVALGYLVFVVWDNGGVTFRGLPAELRQEARDSVGRVRSHLHDYLKGEH